MAYDIGPRIGIEGEAEYRKQIQAITTQQKTLATEMQAVTSAFDKNDQSQENLTAQNKVLTKQIEAQKQKLDLLKDGLSAAAEKYGENDKVTQGWQQAVNKATADLNKMERGLKDNNDVLGKADEVADDASAGIKDFGEAVDDASEKSLSFGDVLKANVLADFIVDGIRNLVGGFKDLATGALDAADSIQQMADQTGMSAEQIQTWQYVGDTLGTSIDTITGAQMKLTKNMQSAAKGTATQADAFKALGVSVVDSNGNLRDAQTVMMEAFGALGNVGNETERNALAMNIFGKSAADLNPLISAGADQLADLAKQAQDTGSVMSGDTVAALDDFGDSMGQVQQSVTAMAGDLISSLLPTIQEMVTAFQDWMGSIDTEKLSGIVSGFFTFVKDNAPNIAAGITGIATAFVAYQATMIATKIPALAMIAVTEAQNAVFAIQAIQALGAKGALELFAGTTKGASVAQWLLNAAMAANPAGIIIAAIVALVAAIVVLWNTNEDFRNAIIGIWENVKATISGVVDALVGFFTKTLPDAWNNLGTFFTAEVPKIVQGIIDWFNQLPEKIGYAIGQVLAGIVNFGKNTMTWIATQLPLIIAGIMVWFNQLPGKVAAQFAAVVSNAVTWAQNMVSTAATEVPKFVNRVLDFVGVLPAKMKDIGKNIVYGIWDGITGAAKWLQEKISGFCSGILKGFQENLEIHSPSRLFADEVGKYVALGIGVGFEDNLKSISAQMSSAVQGIAQNMSVPVNVSAATAAVKSVTSQNNANDFASTQYLNLTLVTPDGVTLGKYIAPFVGKNLEINARNLSPARG
jgi:phage-related protein|nr:MAG TPA: tail tape measure [Caudoviricetes sp.]